MKSLMPKQNDNRLWFFALVISLVLNAYFFFHKKIGKAEQVLATAGTQSFHWKDIAPQAQQSFTQLDRSYYLLLKRQAELWAENYVLPKEAQTKGVRVEDLLKSEVTEKISVTPEETQNVYALSPKADNVPWPDVLKQIEADIRGARFELKKREYLKDLFNRYGVRFSIEPPKSFDGKEPPFPARFPLYVAPPVSSGTDSVTKRIGSAPSKGPANAPVVVEVFSDFHCPYSKAFSGLLNELDKQYPEKMRVIFHHFPLPMHSGAETTHQASVCAQEQGKFWEYHDKLMALKDKPERGVFSQLAGETGIDANTFNACLDGQKYKGWVAQETASAKPVGINSTPSYLINGRLISGMMQAADLKKIIDWHLKPVGRYPGPERPKPSAPSGNKGAGAPGLDPSKLYAFPADWLAKGPSRGPADALITIVEFFDFNCPFCQKGDQVSEQIFAAYPGKVRLVAKNFPLPMHSNAMKTAEAAMCADRQGKYWDFRREIFGEAWGKQSVEDMKAIAKKLNLKEADFNACFDGSQTKPTIEEDMKIFQGHGNAGTPTFFVNGTPVVGAQPLENFRKIIDEKLAKKS